MKTNKLIIFFLILLIALFLQVNWRVAAGWSPEFVVGVLIVSAFYLNLLEVAALSVASAFFLGWRPVPNFEILLLIFLPLFIAYFKKYFPWRNDVNVLISLLFSISVFYSLTNFGALVSDFRIFSFIAAATAFFVFLMFHALNRLYETHQH